MKNVTLQFQKVNELLGFLQRLNIANCEIHWENLTISCHLSEVNLGLALNEFHAKLIDTTEPKDAT